MEIEVELADGTTATSLVLAAPRRTFAPVETSTRRAWGLFVPLYALRTERSLGAADFTAIVDRMLDARRRDGGILWGLGAHVIKTGLSPILVDLKTTGDESGGIDAEVEIRAQIHEGLVARDFARSWQWLAGARYYALDTDVDLSVGGVPSGSSRDGHAWVDPIVGARYQGELGRDWSLRARADVGGFGLGSDLAWKTT